MITDRRPWGPLDRRELATYWRNMTWPERWAFAGSLIGFAVVAAGLIGAAILTPGGPSPW